MMKGLTEILLVISRLSDCSMQTSLRRVWENIVTFMRGKGKIIPSHTYRQEIYRGRERLDRGGRCESW